MLKKSPRDSSKIKNLLVIRIRVHDREVEEDEEADEEEVRL